MHECIYTAQISLDSLIGSTLSYTNGIISIHVYTYYNCILSHGITETFQSALVHLFQLKWRYYTTSEMFYVYHVCNTVQCHNKHEIPADHVCMYMCILGGFILV